MRRLLKTMKPSGACSPLKMRAARSHCRSARQGFGMIELVVSMVLFGVLVSSIGPIVQRVSTASRVTEERRVAQVELANLMERISTLPPSQLNQSNVEVLRLAAKESSRLDEAQLAAVVAEEQDGLRQISLSLTWKPVTGNGMKPVRLTAWFRSESSPPEDAS